ncbi:ATP-binding protein [Paraburkholderia sediminicola]|uniref:AAA family ATPase n=1 Tax=Paraburkholderia sediminicola TaxID=458836 RepID=UPI0038B9664C
MPLGPVHGAGARKRALCGVKFRITSQYSRAMSLTEYNFDRLHEAIQAADERVFTNWRVVTGPPFSGKTTLVAALRDRGYPTIEDCGRRAITEGLGQGQTKVEARSNYELLQERISELMHEEAATRAPRETVIWDYSFPDNLAYLAATGHGWADIHIRRAVQFRFKQTFLLQPVGEFNDLTDPVRAEPLALRHQLYRVMKAVYECLGTSVIEIPALPLDDRVRIG